MIDGSDMDTGEFLLINGLTRKEAKAREIPPRKKDWRLKQLLENFKTAGASTPHKLQRR